MPEKVQHLNLHDLDLNLLRHASEATDLLQSWDIDLWIDNMLDGDEDPVIAIFLILLPNLTRLSYSEFLSFPPCLRYALAIFTDYSQPYRALSRLHEVQCRCVDVEDDSDYGEFESIRAFASLPHTRSITRDCIGTDQNDTLVHRSRPPRSIFLNLTNIAVDPKSLSDSSIPRMAFNASSVRLAAQITIRTVLTRSGSESACRVMLCIHCKI